jgi:CRISPR type III-B/RAMP module RAMP protein Cmr6
MAIDLATACLENAGLSLHPFCSLPVIPGSAVKGCARAAAIARLKEATENRAAERERLLSHILEVFGWAKDDLENRDSDLILAWGGAIPAPAAKANSGRISFLPGLPVEQPRLEIDVLACHHPQYYTTSRATAADDEQPNIQVFPVVGSGSSFLFTIVPLRGASDEILESARRFLAEGLEIWGIGAKTAAGYGYFKEDPKTLAKLEADFGRPSAGSRPGESGPVPAPTPSKSYRESLEQGEKDVMQEFANRERLEAVQQRELLKFILAKGVENALNPAGNPKGSRRVQEFHAWRASLGEGGEL